MEKHFSFVSVSQRFVRKLELRSAAFLSDESSRQRVGSGELEVVSKRVVLRVDVEVDLFEGASVGFCEMKKSVENLENRNLNFERDFMKIS